MVVEDKRRRRPRVVELTDEHLLIQWLDGHESRLPLEDLRRDCPCAVCREHRGAQSEPMGAGAELPMLSAEAQAATAAATGFDYVGRYGVRITWADGHDTGIYVFEALRELDDDDS